MDTNNHKYTPSNYEEYEGGKKNTFRDKNLSFDIFRRCQQHNIVQWWGKLPMMIIFPRKSVAFILFEEHFYNLERQPLLVIIWMLIRSPLRKSNC